MFGQIGLGLLQSISLLRRRLSWRLQSLLRLVLAFGLLVLLFVAALFLWVAMSLRWLLVAVALRWLLVTVVLRLLVVLAVRLPDLSALAQAGQSTFQFQRRLAQLLLHRQLCHKLRSQLLTQK